ncbi:ABC transporter substrate-binding protein [Chromatiales bacterium (ex Bugula neritina AB1)]|nr:ABC transporter substrate-binding protein [Chromatiales bacterium (ex Bugula neritina AB1)]
MIKNTLTTLTLLLLAIAPFSTPLADAKDNLNVVAPWEISSTDPATDGYLFLRMGIMETLVNTDANGALQPGLASEWKVAADGLSWTFTLRDATFHDGTALSAAAVASALLRAAEHPGPLSKAPVRRIKHSGADVVIELESAYAILPAILAHSSTIIPAPASFDNEGKPRSAIGTGPFKIEKLNPPQSLTAVRFDSYWGEAAKLSSANYLAVKRAETRALMAESGDADLVFTLDPSGYKRLSQIKQVTTRSVAIPRVMLVKVNNTHPMLELDARRALSLAIDREGIAAGIMRFPEAAALQLFPPALGHWHDTSLPALSYNPQESQTLLKALGWTAGDDGILTRNGERFSLTLRTFPDRPELPLVGAALQDQWKNIGVELNVSVSNYSEIPAGHQDGSLELALFARNYGATADPTGTVYADFGAGGGDWGSMNWNAPNVAEAIATIAANGEAAVRNPLIKQVASDIHQGLPLLPVAWYQHTLSIASGLDGVIVDPLERSYGLQNISWVK